jgi:hypothetical protein
VWPSWRAFRLQATLPAVYPFHRLRPEGPTLSTALPQPVEGIESRLQANKASFRRLSCPTAWDPVCLPDVNDARVVAGDDPASARGTGILADQNLHQRIGLNARRGPQVTGSSPDSKVGCKELQYLGCDSR